MVLGTNLSNDELLALMRKICRDGFSFPPDYLTPFECWEVGSYIKERFAKLNRTLDLRLLLNGFKDYLQHKNGHSKTDWQTLLEGRMSEQVVYLGRATQKAEQSRIALEIHSLKAPNAAKLKLWQDRTGLTQAAYYRALQRSRHS